MRHDDMKLSRRTFVGAATAGAFLPALARAAAERAPEAGDERPRAERMPVAFVSHGAPTLALDAVQGADLARWARGMPRPKAIVVVSAHWERTPLTVGTPRPRALLYDFRGFPDELYHVRYDAPAAPELAARLARDLGAERKDERPWDHGVWVPLVHMAPEADVPLVQLSLPSRAEPAALVELGRRLAPLRDEGVLVLASGGMVHNLRALQPRGETPAWAREFESWARAALEAHDLDALVDFRAKAPGLAHAHPTLEHFLPLLVAAGAGATASFPVEGFELGSLSRLCVELT